MEPKWPKITILVCSYKERRDWFFQALDSYCNQSYENFEVVLSTIKGDPCVEWAKSFDGVKVIESRTPNVKAQLNHGFKYCSGEYVVQAASDDIMYPKSLQKMCKLLLDKSAIMVYPDLEYCDEHLNMMYRHTPPEFSMEELRKVQIMTDCSLVKKSVLWEFGLLDLSLGKFANWDMFLKIAGKYPFSIHHIPIISIKYRRHDNSLGRTGQGEEFRERFYEKWGITHRYNTMEPSYQVVVS